MLTRTNTKQCHDRRDERDRSRHGHRSGYTLEDGSGCLTIGVHLRHRSNGLLACLPLACLVTLYSTKQAADLRRMRQAVLAMSAIAISAFFAVDNAAAEEASILLTGLAPLAPSDSPAQSGRIQLAQNQGSQAGGGSAPASGELSLDVNVVAKQLDIARQSIEPSLGATVYEFGRQAIETLPQGDNQPLNRLLLQAPGVTQDSFGQIHVRGDHANLQFRLNGIILPEGINVFGQVLQTRLAQSVSLITGALPAQYGLRTAGIIDIQTKTGTLDPGGAFTLYGGQQSTFQPSAEYGGTAGRIDYFATGQVLHNAEGIENPAPTFNAIHDISTQPAGFGYVSGIIDPTTRISSIFGVSRSEFQIPNNPGQTPGLGLTVDGISDFDSSVLNENQRQITDFGIVALQKHVEALNFQVATVVRYSSLYFSPDPLGDLLFNGIGQTASRQSTSNGLQGDGSYRFSDADTLRSGFYFQREHTSSYTNSQVLPVDDSGMQTSDQPTHDF